MKTNIIVMIAVCIVSISLLALPGCGGKPFHYNTPSEIPEGPGVLSGEDGEFTIYDSKSGKGGEKSNTAVEAGAPAAEKSGAEKTGAAVAAGEKMPDSTEYREFQEFLEWKKWKEFKKWQKNQ